jgi:hypothetical protein
MYRTQFFVGTGMQSLLYAHRAVIMNSWHAQLAINLGVLGTAFILFGHIALAFPAYPFLCMDWSAELSLFTHHAWIGGFFIVGSASHWCGGVTGPQALLDSPLELGLHHTGEGSSLRTLVPTDL